MKRFQLAMEVLFQRQLGESEDSSEAYARIAREIRGSILTLVCLFL